VSREADVPQQREKEKKMGLGKAFQGSELKRQRGKKKVKILAAGSHRNSWKNQKRGRDRLIKEENEKYIRTTLKRKGVQDKKRNYEEDWFLTPF